MRSFASLFAAVSVALSVAHASPAMAIPAHIVKRQGDHNAPQTGEMTFYNTGMTSCGIPKTDGDKVAAVSKLFYDSYPGAGPNPNLNPICGQKATVTNPATGKSVVVEIYDRCDGCQFGDIDLTPAAFNEIADPNDGRVHGITWQLGEGAPAPPVETSTEAPPPETTAPPETSTEAPPPPPETSTEAPPPETSTEAPPPETTAPPVEEDPCPPEEVPTETETPVEDPCPPEEEPTETTAAPPTETTTAPGEEDPCPPEEDPTSTETSTEAPPTETDDPCPPEEAPTESEDPTSASTVAPEPTATETPGTGTGSAEEWDANKVYTGGMTACSSGTMYKAKWWTQAEKPGTSDVWAEEGKC